MECCGHRQCNDIGGEERKASFLMYCMVHFLAEVPASKCKGISHPCRCPLGWRGGIEAIHVFHFLYARDYHDPLR
jgi:hypothetical protein